MARLKRDVPELRFHALSGQGRVYIDGKHYYCGPYDSPECQAKFRKLVGEYLLTGSGPQETHHGDAEITVADVTAEARSWIEFKYANDAGRRSGMLRICTVLEDDAGDVAASKFGPRKLAEIRDTFVASRNTRTYVNRQVREIIRIFKFAVSRELVDINVVLALQTLEPLRAGQTKAKESQPVVPANLDDVRKTVKYLSPTVVAMIRIQVATGMRPSEICRIRPKDIDRSGADWIYRLETHKTARFGKTKSVPIVGDARAALQPFMDRDSDEYCFRPEESAQWHRDQRTANRKTPPNCGCKKGTKRAENPRAYNPSFDSCAYRRAITRAAEKAKVPHWYPYQLRHGAATSVREALGVEAAAALLGHSRTSMTDHYAKITEAKAIEAAKAAPSLFG